jgi:hypothetical protein
MNIAPQEKYEVTRVFIQPNLSNQSSFFSITMIVITILIIYFYRYISNNWETFKCHPTAMLFASLFNVNAQQNLQQCLKQTQSEAVYNSVQNLQQEIGNINTEIAKLRSENSGNTTYNVTSDTPGPNAGDPLHNLSITVQQNLLSVKNAMSKILGAFVLSTYMTQGAIPTTQSLSDSNVSKALSKITNM